MVLPRSSRAVVNSAKPSEAFSSDGEIEYIALENPEMVMALRKRPRADGERVSMPTFFAPLLSPMIVILDLSPPKLAILFWTHLSASIASFIYRFQFCGSISGWRMELYATNR